MKVIYIRDSKSKGYLRIGVGEGEEKKEYTVSLKVKADGGTPSVRVGFRCYTADNKAIESHHILTQKGTFTTVAVNAAKGDKILKVKNAADWKPFGYAGGHRFLRRHLWAGAVSG